MENIREELEVAIGSEDMGLAHAILDKIARKSFNELSVNKGGQKTPENEKDEKDVKSFLDGIVELSKNKE